MDLIGNLIPPQFVSIAAILLKGKTFSAILDRLSKLSTIPLRSVSICTKTKTSIKAFLYEKALNILIFACHFHRDAFGQMVKGHVYDAKPMNRYRASTSPTKKINGDTNGTISDADGAYEIALPDGGIDLLFSYIEILRTNNSR